MNKFMYKTDFLNSLFTEKDFKFIDGIDTDLENLHIQINNQKEKKNSILKFINNLNNLLEENNLSADKTQLSTLLINSKKILERTDENVILLNQLESKLKDLNQNIINFLKLVDSNETQDYSNDAKISEIKNSITNYSNLLSDSNSKILLNDIKIDLFVQNSITNNMADSALFDFSNDFQEESAINEKAYNEQKITNTSNSIETKISTVSTEEKIESLTDNNILIISEKKEEVLLPYKISEVNEYINQYPNSYSSFQDVIKKEFILPLNYYIKHPVVARFRESYSLIRDREMKSVIEALKFAIDLMFKYSLNPAIIAACKTQEQLENYLECLESNKLDNFKDFEIKFEVNPL